MSRVLLCCLALVGAADDWPQWRGPARNGVALRSPQLLARLPEGDLPRVWTSEAIPSNDEGGHGSPVVADGRVYLSVVWHRDVPSNTRTIDALVLRKLGHRNLSFPAAVIADMEEKRQNLGRAMRGAKLDAFAKQWVDENLTAQQKLGLADYIIGRFRAGPAATSLADLAKVAKAKNRVFESHEAFTAWLDAQSFADDLRAKVLAAVPPTRREADDVVICLDALSGETIWKAALPGEPTGRGSSSTPTMVGDQVYALGSTHAYRLAAADGTLVWSVPLAARGPASSPLVAGGRVVVQDGYLRALNSTDGSEAWAHKAIKGQNSSPALLGQTVIANSKKALHGVDLKSGKILWEIAGGGDSSPAISGNRLAVLVRNSGLHAFTPSPEGPRLAWKHEYLSRRYAATPHSSRRSCLSARFSASPLCGVRDWKDRVGAVCGVRNLITDFGRR
ncbi:MAG: outer membrane protein assembly factor BamB [Rhodothermales bacterium]